MNTQPHTRHEAVDDGDMVALLAPLRLIRAPAGLSGRVLAACAEDMERTRRWGPWLPRAAYGLAAALAILVFLAPVPHSPSPAVNPVTTGNSQATFTLQEIGAARHDLAWTLEATGRVLDRTSTQVVGEVFGKQLPSIINTTLRHALTINTKGRS